MNNLFRSVLFSTAMLAGTSVHALTVTTVDGTSDNGASLVNALLGASSGLSVTGTSFIGTATQSGVYSGFSLSSSDPGEPTLTLNNGILLTSGSANIGSTNTSSGFGTNNGLAGHAPTDAALAGFPQFDGTNDANVLSFSFTANEATTTSVSMSFVFGSEEFDEFPQFVDSFTFFVDGVNYAVFPNGDPIVQQGTTQGFFNNNVNGSYGVEYDGLSNVLMVTGLLNASLTEHTIEIVVADDGDFILDSGVFLASLSAGTSTGGGIGPMSPVPLPAGFPLLLAGLGAFGLISHRSRTRA